MELVSLAFIKNHFQQVELDNIIVSYLHVFLKRIVSQSAGGDCRIHLLHLHRGIRLP